MKALWRGELPLDMAFWKYAVIYGLIASIVATAAAAGAVMAGLPDVLAIILYLLPAPYYVITIVGVWRSAARDRAAAGWASVARVAVLVWAALMIIL